MPLNAREFELLETTHETVVRLDERFEAVDQRVKTHEIAIFGNGTWGLKANMRLVLWVLGITTAVVIAVMGTAIASHLAGG